jgi:hypothetical protein
MNDFSITSDEDILIAKDAILYAKNNLYINDYRLMCEAQPLKKGRSYQDRIKILHKLISNEIISDNEGRLSLIDTEYNFLNQRLRTGCKVAWGLISKDKKKTIIEKKFDCSHNNEIGLIGELYVISELKKALPKNKHLDIIHTSKTNDLCGYDIETPSISKNNRKFLEVKTSSRNPSIPFRFFISRNEFEVSETTDNWYIVMVKIENNNPGILGHLSSKDIFNRMPKDSNFSSWESAKIEISEDCIRPSLPV